MDDSNDTAAAGNEPITTVPSTSVTPPRIKRYGITTIWPPPDVETPLVADICFVHGLGGHPKDTWQYTKTTRTDTPLPKGEKVSLLKRILRKIKGIFQKMKAMGNHKPESNHLAMEQSSNGNDLVNVSTATGGVFSSQNASQSCYWPFDLVPVDFPNVRVLTYGYDSDPSHFFKSKTNQMTISQHSRQLLQDVTNAREGCRGRPLIFVAHSLGGILVKDAIITSQKFTQQPHMQDLHDSCAAVMFFGTPHRGASIANWVDIVSGVIDVLPLGPSVYTKVVEGLQPGSEKLANVTADFNDILNVHIPAEQKIQLYSFREGEPLTRFARFDGKVVPDDSSHFDRRDIELESFVMKNHIDMCKLNKIAPAETSAYDSFVSALRGYLRLLESRVAAETADITAEVIGAVDYHTRHNRKNALAASVVPRAVSLQWIWTSPLACWLKSDESLFWICGHPASGKSTLMLHLESATETRDYLQETEEGEWMVIHHFFDYRAMDGIENNFAGLIRSLLVQLLASLHQTSVDLFEFQQLRAAIAEQRHTGVQYVALSLCTQMIKQLLEQSNVNVFILLDGLDEYSGSEADLVAYILEIACLKGVKICVASRPTVSLSEAFGQAASLSMEKCNLPGIHAHATEVLRAFFSKSRNFAKLDIASVATSIANKSSGIFIWAHLAINIMTRGLAETQDIDSSVLKDRLEDVPSELKQIYATIVKNIPVEYQAVAALTFLLISTSMQPITTELLRLATTLVPDNYKEFTTAKRLAQSCKTEGSWASILLSATGGLLEYGEARHKVMVRLLPRPIHRTVLKFLFESGPQISIIFDLDRHKGHHLWLELLSAELSRRKNSIYRIVRGMPRTKQALGGAFRYPEFVETSSVAGGPGPSCDSQILQRYAISFLFSHAARLDVLPDTCWYTTFRESITSTIAHLHHFLDREYCNDSSKALQDIREAPDYPEALIPIAIAHRMLNYVRNSLEGSSVLVTRDSIYEAYWSIGDQDMDEHSDIPKSLMTTKEAALRCALFRAFNAPQPGQGDMIKTLIKLHDQVDEVDFLMVMKSATPEVVEILVKHRSSRPLRLRRKHGYVTHVLLLDFKEELDFGPFWIIARRRADQGRLTNELVEALIRAGEDINGICGPFGTALHGIVECKTNVDFQSHLDILISHGADVNIPGRFGNALEFAWKLLNTWEVNYVRKVALDLNWHELRRRLRSLIHLGAVNARADPNGKVPTREQMLDWGQTYQHALECQRYYKECEYGDWPTAQWDLPSEEEQPQQESPDVNTSTRYNLRSRKAQRVPTPS